MQRFSAVLVMIWAASVVCADDCLDHAGQWGTNQVRALTVHGDRAFSMVDNALVVTDVSDLQQPAELGRVDLGGHYTSWGNLIAVDGYLYAAQSSELVVVAVHDPSLPVIVGRHQVSSVSFVCSPHLSVSDDLLWVSNCDTLNAFDISDPPQPALVGAFPIDARTLAVQGDYGYATAPVGMHSPRGLDIIDLSDPFDPEVLATFSAEDLWPSGQPNLPTPNRLSAVAVKDDRLWLTTNRGFALCDLSDPLHPTPVGAFELDPMWYGDEDWLVADPSRDLVYLVRDRLGLFVVNVSDPSLPSVLATWTPDRELRGLFAHESTLFTAGHGLHVLDVRDPQTPVQVNPPLELRNAALVVGSGTTLVAQDREVGLRVLVASGSGPVQSTATLDADWLIWDMAVADDLVAVAESGELKLLDVADPFAPSVLSTMPSQAHHVVLSAGGQRMYTYLHEGDDQLRIFDISEPTAPDLISETPLYDIEGALLRGIGEMELANGYLWVMGETDHLICKLHWDDEYWSGEHALLAVDVSDPLSPVTVGSCRLGCVWEQSLALSSTHAYANGYNGGYDWETAVIDVRDATAPAPVLQGHGGFPYATRLQMVNGLLLANYETGTTSGVQLYDLERPEYPEQVAVFEHSSASRDAAVLGRWIYLTAGAAGIVTLDGRGCLSATAFPSPHVPVSVSVPD